MPSEDARKAHFVLPEGCMHETEILPTREVAQLVGTSPRASRNAIARGREGDTIPPSFKLGGRRVWLRSIVYAWLHKKARTGGAQCSPAQHSNPQALLNPDEEVRQVTQITPGQIY